MWKGKEKAQDIDSLAAAINKRNRARKIEKAERTVKRKGEALEEVRRLVKEFKELDPDLKRVILFGSLGEDRIKSERFDIDLAMEGKEYLKCVYLALDSTFKVDLLDLSALRKDFKEQIEHYGREVFPGGEAAHGDD